MSFQLQNTQRQTLAYQPSKKSTLRLDTIINSSTDYRDHKAITLKIVIVVYKYEKRKGFEL